jgi:hypothetical protein
MNCQLRIFLLQVSVISGTFFFMFQASLNTRAYESAFCSAILLDLLLPTCP